MINKKILPLLFLFVLFSASFASADTCLTSEVLEGLRKALYTYYDNPAASTFTEDELGNLLTLYMGIGDNQLSINCDIEQKSKINLANVMPDNIPSCSDGTKYGKCSSTKPMYCYAGNLVPRCRLCGALQGEWCDVTYVYSEKGNEGRWGLSYAGTDVTCVVDSDCGTSGYLGNYYCQEGDIYGYYNKHTCLSPGETSSSCLNETMGVLVDDCPTGCQDGACVEESTPPCDSYGDVNNDGYITDEDANLIANDIVGNIDLTSEQKSRADVDANGLVSISDALFIAQYAAGQRTTFPVCEQIPTCTGTDSDGDGYGIDCDCYDQRADINPGQVEVCGNTFDDNCNEEVNEGCEPRYPEEDWSDAALWNYPGTQCTGYGDINRDSNTYGYVLFNDGGVMRYASDFCHVQSGSNVVEQVSCAGANFYGWGGTICPNGCQDGACVEETNTCSGWMNAGLCWYEGAQGESCTSGCSTHGGVGVTDCFWCTEDNNGCAYPGDFLSVCLHFHPGAINMGWSGDGPKYWVGLNYCYSRSALDYNSCGIAPAESKRQCACALSEAVCTPTCEGKECGDDGCGGLCGTCPTGKVCDTTISACVTPVNETNATCTDSDGGEDYYVKGTVVVGDSSYDDICNKDTAGIPLNGNYPAEAVVEKYCVDDTIGIEYYTCPNGCDYDAGACVEETNVTTCTDSNGDGAPNTDWGDDLYDCIGSDKRCYGGECKTCGGFVYANGLGGTGCWYNANALGDSCTIACSTHGGNAGTCRENDDTSCTVCKHYYPSSNCKGAGYGYDAGTWFDKVAPFHTQSWGYYPGCRYSSSVDVDPISCDYAHEPHDNILTRFCVCNY